MINKLLPTFILFFFSSFLFSQENFIYDFDLITQSVSELIENEEYEQALKEIEKIHFLDPNYLKSLGFKAEILGYMDKGDEKIDLLKKAFDEGKFIEYPEFYTLLAQSYNSAERYTESIEMLDNGISNFPDFALLYFYRCISNYGEGRIQAAVNDAKTTIELDPNIARAHYILGIIALEKGEVVPGFLSLMGYLALRPEDDFSRNVIIMLDKELSSNYKDLAGIVFSKTGDDFTDLNDILRNDLPLNKKYKLECKLDYNYTRYLQAVIEYAKDHEIQDGFFENQYIRFLKEIAENRKTVDFTYYTLASFEDGKIGKFVRKKYNDIIEFNKEYIDDEFDKTFFSKIKEVDGEKKKISYIYRDGNPFLKGEIKDGKYENDYIYIDEYGRKIGVYPYKDGKLNGIAVLNYLDGNLSEKIEFKDDQRNGLSIGYNKLGDVIYSAGYKEGELHGEYMYSYNMGGKECIEQYENGKAEGEVKCYYRNGQQSTSLTYKDNKRHGKATYYYLNGNKSAEYTYVDGKLEGPGVTYSIDGSILNELVYEEDELKLPYKIYNKYGELESEGKRENGQEITIEYDPFGDKIYYYFEGEDIVKTESYENDKLTYSFTFKSGKVNGIFNHMEGPKPKKLNKNTITYYNIYGIKRSTRNYKKLSLEGESIFYYPNGNISKKQNLVNNKLEGIETTYDINGDLKSISTYQKDTLNGLYTEYNDGRKYYDCYYKDGEVNGPLTFYDRNGVKSQVRFYSNGIPLSEIDYDPEGGVAHRCDYSEGEISEIVYYNKGEKMDSINYNFKNGPISFSYNGYETVKSTLKNGVFEGEYKVIHTGGFVEVESNYVNGERNGNYKYYAPSEKKSSEYTYEYGTREKTAIWHDHLGILRSKAEFRMDEYHGLSTSFYNDGTVFRTNEYIADKQNGKKTYYNRSGDTLLVLTYIGDLVHWYQIRTEEGKIGPKQKCDNKRTELLVKYEDGSTALNIVINEMYVDEKLEVYSRNGNIAYVKNRTNGYLEGEFIIYHPNGEKYVVRNYKKGDLNGETNYYDENGVIQLQIEYKNDSFNGPYKIYENGKLKETKLFKNGLFIGTE